MSSKEPQHPIDYYYDRDRQQHILDTFVEHGSIASHKLLSVFPNIDEDILMRELAYLEGHGLISFNSQVCATIKLTPKAIDFLKGDGGPNFKRLSY